MRIVSVPTQPSGARFGGQQPFGDGMEPSLAGRVSTNTSPEPDEPSVARAAVAPGCSARRVPLTDSVTLRWIKTISRCGHERSECLSAFHCPADGFNAC